MGNNSKTQNARVVYSFMTYCLNVMHAAIKFHEYIPYGSELWPGHGLLYETM